MDCPGIGVVFAFYDTTVVEGQKYLTRKDADDLTTNLERNNVMSIYAKIKQAVSVPEAAKHYGLTVTRHGMACCPFHPDSTPSLKLNEDFFYCFGCGKTGDVIDFVANLFQISQPQAAERLAADFGIEPPPPGTAMKAKETSSITEYPLVREFRKEEVFCIRVLNDYEQLLEHWKETCAPVSPGDPWDDRYVESCQMLPTVRCILDLLTAVDFKGCHTIVQRLKEDDYLLSLQSYVAEKRKETY